MYFDYIAEMGVPNKNKIVLSNDRLDCNFTDKDYDAEQIFYVANIATGLSLLFSLDGGCLVGARVANINLDLIPQSEIELPDYIEGKVRARGRKYYYLKDCYFMDFRNDGLSYDRRNGLIAFGNLQDAYLTVRTCENLFVSLDDSNRLVAAVVRI